MADDLLNRLQVRKQPKPYVPVRIRVPARPKAREDEQSDESKEGPKRAPQRKGPRMVDKRRTAKFDRMAFLDALNQPTQLTAGPAPPPRPARPARTTRAPPEPRDEADVPPADSAKATAPKPKRRLRLVRPPAPGVEKSSPKSRAVPLNMLQISDQTLAERIAAKPPPPQIRASAYYLNNREIFVNFMTSLFAKYRREMGMVESSATCERSEGDEFQAMGHQKLVRDYLALYTPYRGILLYHGLGAGKTCSSIAIAEGLKSTRKVIVMVPASLRMNYMEELKKCGDHLYRKNQHWEFVSVRDKPTAAVSLATGLGIAPEYVRKAKGAWVMNPKKTPNFDELSASAQRSLNDQLDAMIQEKYEFINYNGMRASHLEKMSDGYTKNPFNDCAVVIDEAHNFVSRIINKLSRNQNDSLSVRMYNYLMDAQNARVVLLTGTPIINYPNEIGIMFNMVRGRIQTWNFKLTVAGTSRVTQNTIRSIFKSTVLGGNVMDYVEYRPTSSTLTVTRNPYGFVNKTVKGTYKGVRAGDRGELTNDEFVAHVTKQLGKHSIRIQPGATQIINYKALPDTAEDFAAYFLSPDSGGTKNLELFKRRILGLASYFRDIEALMPRYNKSTDFHIVNIPMSDFQIGVYEEARTQERKREREAALKAKKKKQGPEGVFEETVSTYRIFSRAFCNYVFPSPTIKRPMPGPPPDATGGKVAAAATEDLLDAVEARDVQDEEEAGTPPDAEYQERIKSALRDLDEQKDTYLTPSALEIYSPKFKAILESVSDPTHTGPHLVYSQFRTLEGIGILRLVFLANGYAEFKLAKGPEGWRLDVPPEARGKPMFVLYTGTETAEEREMVRNAFNGAWGALPPELAAELREIHTDNMRGEVIKLIMITASGAEGISLKNVRYVHITEPYWHPVRIEQVIGRARRLCSHQQLPEEERTVEVFLYLMAFSEAQLLSDEWITLRTQDKSKIDLNQPVTSDQHLYEIATMKEEITGQLLQAVREASIDCALHSKAGDPTAPKCFTFGAPGPEKFAYKPSYADEEADAVADRNKTVVQWEAREMTDHGVKYALNPADNKVYDLESYLAAVAGHGQPIQVGNLEKDSRGKLRYVPI